jgi:hypothetical protein
MRTTVRAMSSTPSDARHLADRELLVLDFREVSRGRGAVRAARGLDDLVDRTARAAARRS